jgi:uncharacterized damage-inducible protein DinB
MTKEERERKIESYGSAYAQLVEALKQIPKAAWEFKPAPDRWSVHQIIVHIADSEANGYVRCRRFVAEPGKSVMAYDQELWAEALRYQEQSVEDALELFKWLRQANYRLVSSLPEPVWSNTVEHPERGTMTLDNWLDIYERHIPGHINQMKKVFEEWKVAQSRT